MTQAAEHEGRIDEQPDSARQAELLSAVQANRKLRKPPFENVRIATYGELMWIVRKRVFRLASLRALFLDDVFGMYARMFFLGVVQPGPDVDLRNANLRGTNLKGLRLGRRLNIRGACLAGANLEGASLRNANLDGTDMTGAFLKEADLSGQSRFVRIMLVMFAAMVIVGESALLFVTTRVNLSSSYSNFGLIYGSYVLLFALLLLIPRLIRSSLLPLNPLLRHKGPDLSDAHLEGANLSYRSFPNAVLRGAHLEDADFTGTFLFAADLRTAHLDNTNLSATDLRRGHLDGVQVLDAVLLESRTRLEEVYWDDTPLHPAGDTGKKSLRQRAAAHRDAGRVYRTLGRALRERGLAAQAVSYRLLELRAERRADFWGVYPASWLGSWVLNLLSGYGYRPGRTLLSYVVVIIGFAWAYMQVTQAGSLLGLTAPTGVRPLQWYEAAVLSVSAFHGRGFFQPLQNPGDSIAVLAAAEAVLGLLIEVSFIATFTQRFFGSR